jgi:hypothetical protein
MLVLVLGLGLELHGLIRAKVNVRARIKAQIVIESRLR